MKRWTRLVAVDTVRKLQPALFLMLAAAFSAYASEQDAVSISNNIQALHLPYNVIIDPVFAGPTSQQVVGYSRGGNASIWTGHYLAAEAFRYKVTNSSDAIDNVRKALAGIRSLVDVTGTNLLARCVIPVDSPYAQGIITEEAGHGIFTGSLGDQTYYWIGNTVRDEYAGVFFGLGVAYDAVEDATVRSEIREITTRLLDFLLQNDWAVVTPTGVSTVFWGRPDQQLSFLQVGRRVNPDRFQSTYRNYRFWYASTVIVPISYDVLEDHGSYFKFNLNSITLYNLIRLEDSSYYRWLYMNAYNVLRRTTDDHRNGHFNMIDRGLKGPDGGRDAETRSLLEEWLSRSRRDEWVDWRPDPRYQPPCGEDRACDTIPIADRVHTDFLWQRSPFLLYGGGQGNIEGAGIDYILPYWMARYYGVL